MAGTPPLRALVIDDEPALRDLLADFLMPGLTGAEVVEALQRRNPAAKIVMVTGSAMDEDIAGVRERGVTVLAKPVSLDRFSAVIAEVLGEARRAA